MRSGTRLLTILAVALLFGVLAPLEARATDYFMDFGTSGRDCVVLGEIWNYSDANGWSYRGIGGCEFDHATSQEMGDNLWACRSDFRSSEAVIYYETYDTIKVSMGAGDDTVRWANNLEECYSHDGQYIYVYAYPGSQWNGHKWVIWGDNGDDQIFGCNNYNADHCTGNMKFVADGRYGDDYVTGSDSTTYGDKLWGGPGSDWVSGLGGNDELHGGVGPDVVDGGDGDDTMYGDDSAGGSCWGGEGCDDCMRGQGGADTMYGGAGDDGMKGGEGYDAMQGNAGSCNYLDGQDDGASCICGTSSTGNIGERVNCSMFPILGYCSDDDSCDCMLD